MVVEKLLPVCSVTPCRRTLKVKEAERGSVAAVCLRRPDFINQEGSRPRWKAHSAKTVCHLTHGHFIHTHTRPVITRLPLALSHKETPSRNKSSQARLLLRGGRSCYRGVSDGEAELECLPRCRSSAFIITPTSFGVHTIPTNVCGNEK